MVSLLHILKDGDGRAMIVATAIGTMARVTVGRFGPMVVALRVRCRTRPRLHALSLSPPAFVYMCNISGKFCWRYYYSYFARQNAAVEHVLRMLCYVPFAALTRHAQYCCRYLGAGGVRLPRLRGRLELPQGRLQHQLQ